MPGPDLPSKVNNIKGRGLGYQDQVYYLTTQGQVYRLGTDSWTAVGSLGTVEPMSFSGQVFNSDILQSACTDYWDFEDDTLKVRTGLYLQSDGFSVGSTKEEWTADFEGAEFLVAQQLYMSSCIFFFWLFVSSVLTKLKSDKVYICTWPNQIGNYQKNQN